MADLAALLLAFRGQDKPRVSGASPGKSGFAAIQRELLEEACGALGRTGRRLEACRAELDELRASYAVVPLPLTRAAYQRVRARYLELLTELEIQREAVGLRRHEAVRAHYPVPPGLPEPEGR